MPPPPPHAAPVPAVTLAQVWTAPQYAAAEDTYLPALVNGEAFRLLAGMLLLFTTDKDRKRFDPNTRSRRRRRVPIDGWKMEHTEVVPVPVRPPAKKAPPKAEVPCPRRPACPCACPEPQLTAMISGQPQPAEPWDTLRCTCLTRWRTTDFICAGP
ncbi:hypothetical protein ACFVT6_21795 [Streptomyces sp. NPDC058049]|uniref:hypothetical protein n=1 Tax=Streptomyces sp. NPDC058049 TaxID=3346314 RepID=UPI0036E8C614